MHIESGKWMKYENIHWSQWFYPQERWCICMPMNFLMYPINGLSIICGYEMAETFPFRMCCLSLYFHLIFCPVPFEHFLFTSCLSTLILFLLILLISCPRLPTALNVGGDNVSVLWADLMSRFNPWSWIQQHLWVVINRNYIHSTLSWPSVVFKPKWNSLVGGVSCLFSAVPTSEHSTFKFYL